MQMPDYTGGGTVNLMASVVTALGGEATGYPGAGLLQDTALGEARRVLLLVIDGLGYDYLCGPGSDGHLHRHLRGPLSAVAPPTTASAIPTFLTGLAPAAHGFTGWHMWLRELGCVTTILPYVTRYGHLALDPALPGPRGLSGVMPLSQRLPVACDIVSPRHIAASTFNRAFSGRAGSRPYDDLPGFLGQIRRALTARGGRRFVYAYWPELDTLAHEHGIASTQVRQHFADLDSALGELWRQLAGSATAVLLTADHGFVDVPPGRHIDLQDHPELAECLTLPLCGESRFAYCYVRPRLRRRFETYVTTRLAAQVELLDSHETVRRGLFGPPPHHPRLLDRVGDYILCMREDWAIKDWLPGEKAFRHVGAHGGLSDAELRVPLVYAEV